MIRPLVYAIIVAGLSLYLFSGAGESLPRVAFGVSFTVIAVSQGFYAFLALVNKRRTQLPVIPSERLQTIEDAEMSHGMTGSVAPRPVRLIFDVTVAVVWTIIIAMLIFGSALAIMHGLSLWEEALMQFAASLWTIGVLNYWQKLIERLRRPDKSKYRFRINSDRRSD